MDFKMIAQFRELTEASKWINTFASGPCTIVIHADPYEANQYNYEEDGNYLRWGLKRMYPTEFYLKGN